jgi:hypothetical protein
MTWKNKNIRDLYKGVNTFQQGYQFVTKMVKDENAALLEGAHTI